MSANIKSALRSTVIRLVLLVSLVSCTAGLAAQPVQVEVSGLQEEPLNNVLASLEIVGRSQDTELTAENINRMHAKADAEIRRALQPFGYYQPTITTDLQAPKATGGNWLAIYTVDTGDPVPVNHVDLSFIGPGSTSEDLKGLAESLQSLQGNSLDHQRYEAGKRKLISDTRELGYLNAEFLEHRVEVDLKEYIASITVVIETGPRFVYGDIELKQGKFSSDYLARYMILKPGNTFKHSELAQQRNLLSASGHFSEVVIKPGEPTTGENPEIPLVIGMEPLPANRYRGRAGWGTDTGFGLGLDWTRRHLGKRGHHFNVGVAVAEERERLAGDVSYTVPLDPLRGEAFEIGLRHESKDLNYTDVSLDEGGETRIATNLATALWRLPVSKFGDFVLQSSAGVSLVGENYDIFEVLFGNLPSSAQDSIIESIGTEAYETLAPEFEAVVPGLSFKFKRTDDPLYIRRGDYLSLELLGASEDLGSNIDFWQARFSSWSIWPVADQGRFLFRSNLGYTDAESRSVLNVNFNQMPEYYEFRAGGARSIRGYGWETLFPSDAITGGKHLIVASVEYEHEIIPDWSVAAFLDGGNAFNEFDDFKEKLGTGIGVRWRSPVGLARIDLGFPLDDADEAFQIYITVGPEF
ncbi:MAG: BamA/TamA family outer membrane protein [Halioglobus sp.]